MGATLRKRGRPTKAERNPPHQHHQNNGDGQTIGNGNHKISDYELCREERIKENLVRMQKLGILDLSLKLKPLKPTPQNSSLSYRRTPLRLSPLPPYGPTRRSSRLQNVTPVTYSEVHLSKKYGSLEEEEDLFTGGFKPEVYTEEHEKLLGSTEMNWTLFVDGCGKDGKRIYDPVIGKTCHQCRQKTLGHRTHCIQCNMVQGQFCGDCLYMRYGEHVLEANQNPNWICPVCRGICNCSLCRQAKGWPPTGALYRKVSSLGFKSVAHYLIQTRLIKAGSESNSNIKVPVTAKRSLPFSDIEMTEEKEFPDSSAPQGLVNVESDEKGMEYDHKSAKDTELSCPNSVSAHRNSASDKTTEQIHLHKPTHGKEKEADDLDSKNTDTLASEGAKEPLQKPVNTSGSTDVIHGTSDPETKYNGNCNAFKDITGPVQNFAVATDWNFASQTTTEHIHKPPSPAPRSSDDFINDKDGHDMNNKHSDVIFPLEATNEHIPNSTNYGDDSQVLLSPFSEEKKDGEIKSKEEEEVPQKFIKSNRKPPHATEPNTDSIAGRLKRRRSRGDKEDKLDQSTGMNLDVEKTIPSSATLCESMVEKNSNLTRFDSIADRLKSRHKRI